MSAFPATDPRYAEILAARGGPRAHGRKDHQWVRVSRHFCQQYRHRPADSQRLPLFLDRLASKNPTTAPRAQAHCAVDSYAVCWSPEWRSWRDDAVAPTAPKDGEDGLAARKQASVSGQPPRMEAHAHVLVHAHGASEQTNAAWREAEAKLKDQIMLRHYSPKTRQA
jgi:hypothetical protein